MDDTAAGCSIVCLIGVFFICGCLVGGCVTKDIEREQATKAGVGRYEVNAATGTTKFVYGVKPDPRPDHLSPAEATSR